MGRAAQAFMAPLQEGVTTATRPVGDFFTGLAHLPSLARENEELKDEVAALRAQTALYADDQRQLQQVEDLLLLRQSLHPSSVAAVVIGNGISNFDWSITIDKGTNDGVAVGQPVVTGSADAPQLVGVVFSATTVSANVQLLIDRNFQVAGKLGTSGETGLVVGEGDQDLQLQNVPPGTEFPTGDQPEYVSTVSYEIGGQHGRYPPGILIGEVSSVHEGSNALDTDISVRPAVDFSALEFVLVLQTPDTGSAP
jgi:rod shape-determining protein MreC